MDIILLNSKFQNLYQFLLVAENLFLLPCVFGYLIEKYSKSIL
jgi:hypothetical protein